MFDAFLKLSTIPGESTDSKHAEWIEIESFHWGVNQRAGAAGASALGGHTGGRADFDDMSVVKLIDKASPKLLLACAAGEHIPDVTIELCKAGGDKQKYLEIKMNDVVVSSYRPGGSAKSESVVPMEEVTLRCAKITWNYTVLDTKTGAPKGTVNAGWDLSTNAKL